MEVYQPSRYLLDFHLAGFAYWDGTKVANELEIGSPLQLQIETSNPFDQEAVAIYFHDKKIGYVPAQKNSWLFSLLFFGYGEFLEAEIQSVDLHQHPERQFRVVVRLKDHR
ncbi:HIRAN domain-containing protein [Enterococcus timonensis]|uniref:HIRAN domain-containing protein n=1 Tax=Enterococcus timonensis TaxID=1852364 RepID=UPI0008D90000|nr:HIRAN domain-containing protein [Enterococcus timonensis]